MEQLVMVSSCGTSSLTNGADGEMRDLLRRTANYGKREYSEEDLRKVDDRVRCVREKLFSSSPEDVKRVSAELHGLISYYGNTLSNANQNTHIFLHTDTYQGECVAGILVDWMLKQKQNAQSQAVEGLNTKNADSFREGMSRLVRWCDETIRGYRDQKYRVVFNLVGGFKVLQGFLQTLGMFFADESVYVFEGEESLLRIPRLPLDLDDGTKRVMRDNIDLFRRLDWSDGVKRTECASLPDTLVYCAGEECVFSPWGELLWSRIRPELYEDKVLPSPSPKIRFTKAAEETMKDFDKERRSQFNERLDDLARHLESGRSGNTNVNRLDFKTLEGNPKPPATHEFDLWADRRGWRGFGHFDGNVFVLDSVGEGIGHR